MALLTVSSSFANGKIKVCTQKCEAITEKHFMKKYKKMCKTEEGRKHVILRIKDFKRKNLKLCGKPFKEKEITADCEDENDLKLISQISPFNKDSEKKGNQRIPFSSPFEYGMQCIHQCRTGKVDEDAPKIFKNSSKKSDDESTDDEE